MATLYLDENVSNLIVADLALNGCTATTTSGEGRKGTLDADQLLFAAERDWTIVTHNGRDFHLLHHAWLLWSRRWEIRASHAGILVVEQHERQSATDVAAVIAMLLADPGTALESALYDWKRSTGWVKLPQERS